MTWPFGIMVLFAAWGVVAATWLLTAWVVEYALPWLRRQYRDFWAGYELGNQFKAGRIIGPVIIVTEVRQEDGTVYSRQEILGYCEQHRLISFALSDAADSGNGVFVTIRRAGVPRG